jgi:hypothetical protein
MIAERIFLKHSLVATGVLAVLPAQKAFPSPPPGIKLSLAVWSFRRTI